MKQFIIYFSALLVISCSGRPGAQKTGLEGKPMPDFSLLLLDSITHLDTKNIPTGEPVVLFFFGPNCPYSRAQMQEIVSNIGSMKNIRFYAFTTESIPSVKAFSDHYKLKQFPNIIIGQDYAISFANYYKVPGVPCLALYGADKKLKEVLLGKQDVKEIKDVLFN